MAPDGSASMSDITRTLAIAVREAGLTQKALETRLGWSAGVASRLLAGERELRVQQLLVILRTIGMRPSKFFALVEATAVLEDTPALRLAILRALTNAEPSEEIDTELDARIEQVARRILASRNPPGV